MTRFWPKAASRCDPRGAGCPEGGIGSTFVRRKPQGGTPQGTPTAPRCRHRSQATCEQNKPSPDPAWRSRLGSHFRFSAKRGGSRTGPPSRGRPRLNDVTDQQPSTSPKHYSGRLLLAVHPFSAPCSRGTVVIPFGGRSGSAQKLCHKTRHFRASLYYSYRILLIQASKRIACHHPPRDQIKVARCCLDIPGSFWMETGL